MPTLQLCCCFLICKLNPIYDICRNRCAEELYGYSASEAVGQDITRLIIVPGDIPALNKIIGNVFTGKCWRGKFPVRNKSGDRFFVVADATPLCDDDGRFVGLICLADDTQTMEELIAPLTL